MIALVSSLHSNVFITGLNQLSDVAIDKINKPYLPLVGLVLCILPLCRATVSPFCRPPGSSV